MYFHSPKRAKMTDIYGYADKKYASHGSLFSHLFLLCLFRSKSYSQRSVMLSLSTLILLPQLLSEVESFKRSTRKFF